MDTPESPGRCLRLYSNDWCRMPAGTSTDSADPRTVAVLPHIVPRLGELLGRDLVSEPAPIGARAGLIQTLR
jgi:hypothetical protein